MSLVKAFEAIGAEARIRLFDGRNIGNDDGFTIDIARDGDQEIFDIRVDPRLGTEVSVVDRQPKDRHLLLMVRTDARVGVPAKTKFLCGHDERHWFVASVNPTVADVRTAKESLKPVEVTAVQDQAKGKRKKRVRGGIRRQGEWFFIPKPRMKVPANQILKNEFIRREGGGKPHVVEEVYRLGGDAVYENERGVVLSSVEFRNLAKRNPTAGSHFRAARVNAKVFGRGKVTHPDHATIDLKVWHQIVPNTEDQFATRSLRFVD